MTKKKMVLCGALLSTLAAASAWAMASYIKCVVRNYPCMCMEDGTVGYCVDEFCAPALYVYSE